MRSSPHPNQVRSACERCRQHKLRCLRQPELGIACSRCARLGFQCESGTQREVGRPAKRAALARRRSPSENEMVKDLEAVGPKDSTNSLGLWHNSLTSGVFFADWALPATSPRAAGPVEGASPAEHWLISSDSSPDSPDSGTTDIQKIDAVFQSLSEVHTKLRALSDVWTRQGSHVDFDAFYCAPKNPFDPVEAMRIIFATSQEFLGVLKALHRRVGTSSAVARTSSQQLHETQMPWMCTPMFMHLHLQTETDPSNDGTEEATSEPIIDLPTASLVVSSYSHLLTATEKFFAMKHARLKDFLEGPLRSNLAFPNLKFAGIPLVEIGLQGVMFSEGMLHLLSQTNLLLGVPSRWAMRCKWTGLLSSQKYRAMLNKELGFVEGSWSTRPLQVHETIIMAKDAVQELAMLGYS